MITGIQIKMARVAVGWGVRELATASGLAATTVTRVENSGEAFGSTLVKLQAALESRGVTFIADRQPSPDGGPGVRLGFTVAAQAARTASKPKPAAKAGGKGRAKPARSGRGGK